MTKKRIPQRIIIVPIILLAKKLSINALEIVAISLAIANAPKYTNKYHQCSKNVRYPKPPNTNTTPTNWIMP